MKIRFKHVFTIYLLLMRCYYYYKNNVNITIMNVVSYITIFIQSMKLYYYYINFALIISSSDTTLY